VVASSFNIISKREPMRSVPKRRRLAHLGTCQA
jgi:hypothetical protein